MFGPDTELLSGRPWCLWTSAHLRLSPAARELFSPQWRASCDRVPTITTGLIAYVLAVHALNMRFSPHGRKRDGGPELARMSIDVRSQLDEPRGSPRKPDL